MFVLTYWNVPQYLFTCANCLVPQISFHNFLVVKYVLNFTIVFRLQFTIKKMYMISFEILKLRYAPETINLLQILILLKIKYMLLNRNIILSHNVISMCWYTHTYICMCMFFFFLVLHPFIINPLGIQRRYICYHPFLVILDTPRYSLWK